MGTLIPISVIVALSLVVAWVLFGVLDSTGLIKNDVAEFGGAAAGFFATLIFLRRWYDKLDERRNRTSQLESLSKLDVPGIETREGFQSFTDTQNAIGFAHPQTWQHESTYVLQVFTEATRKKQAFRANFNFTVESVGLKNLDLSTVSKFAQRRNISIDSVQEALGVTISERTESLEVPLEKAMAALGVTTSDRPEQIYELMSWQIEGTSVAQTTDVIGGLPSRVHEYHRRPDGKEPYVQFACMTLDEKTNRLITFWFSAALAERDEMDLLRKQVLSSVKLWS
jgi:hypothetical protein